MKQLKLGEYEDYKKIVIKNRNMLLHLQIVLEKTLSRRDNKML